MTTKSTKTNTKSVQLPPIERRRVCVRLVGDESLLVNRFAEKAITQILANSRGIPMDRPPKDPHEEYKNAKYLNVKGQPALPIMTIKKAMTEAVSLLYKRTDLSGKAAKGAFYIKGQCALLKFEEETMHVAPVRVGQNGTDIRFRPEYHEWHCDLVLDFDPNMITLEQLLHLLRGAGQSIGLCELRVQKNGNHGIFHIEVLPDTEMKRIMKESSIPPKPLVLPAFVMRELNLDEMEQLVIDAKNAKPAGKKVAKKPVKKPAKKKLTKKGRKEA